MIPYCRRFINTINTIIHENNQSKALSLWEIDSSLNFIALSGDKAYSKAEKESNFNYNNDNLIRLDRLQRQRIHHNDNNREFKFKHNLQPLAPS